MNRFLIFIGFCLCCFFIANGQKKQKSDSLSLKDLEIPNSPGLILLDKTPSTIERPNSSKAFMLSVINSFSINNGIPQNYAVDFTPFWFFKHPKMTSYRYMGYNKETDRQHVFKDIKKASISFAFVTSEDSVTKQKKVDLSFGIRTNIISIRSKNDIEDYKIANAKVVKYLKDSEERMKLAGIVYPIPEDTTVKPKLCSTNKEIRIIPSKVLL